MCKQKTTLNALSAFSEQLGIIFMYTAECVLLVYFLYIFFGEIKLCRLNGTLFEVPVFELFSNIMCSSRERLT